MKTSFSIRAQRLEQENIAAYQEIDMLKHEIREKTEYIEEIISQLNAAREECSKLRRICINSNNESNYYENNYCDCDCEGCIYKKNPLKEIELAESRIRQIIRQNEQLTKDVAYMKEENEKWSDFCYRIYGITSNSLKYFPDFPKDTEAQRTICTNLVGKVCKYGCKEIDEHSAFEHLKSKYRSVTSSHRIIHSECDYLNDICEMEPHKCHIKRKGAITIAEDRVFNRKQSILKNMKPCKERTSLSSDSLMSSSTVGKPTTQSISTIISHADKSVLCHTSSRINAN